MLTTNVSIILKLVNWFALQINWMIPNTEVNLFPDISLQIL